MAATVFHQPLTSNLLPSTIYHLPSYHLPSYHLSSHPLPGIICECIRLVLSQKLLQGAAIKFNPLTGVYYTAPLSFLTLLIPW
jgi:hypothetical protein